ncbi:MAG: acyl carrier protein [Firmicutes bacterium]|nr:acyl carrier protein [Bacillota bacterium]
MSDKLFLQVRKMIAEHLNQVEEQITMDSSFTDDLGADSLDLIEMIMGMEEMFDIEISESEAESIKTVGDAVRFIQQHLE